MQRIIHLRRPPVLHVQDTPFVPDNSALDEVDHRWSALRESNPAYFDGRMLHVLGVHRNGYGGAVLHVVDCAYRFHATQSDDFDLGVRSLGTKGLTMRNSCILLGLRSNDVAHYKNMWEFAPGGVVEPGEEPAHVVVNELHEETGLRPAAHPTPVAIVYDHVLRCWEIVFRIDAAAVADEPSTEEYSQLRWCAPDDLPDDLTPVSKTMTSLLSASA